MKKYFGDKSITIHFIQQILNETFNENVYISGEYYDYFDMNYGLAHFIAKYLDFMYPVLDAETQSEYDNMEDKSEARPITSPISISNYFLCNNKQGKLYYDPDNPNSLQNETYNKIYNSYMRAIKKVEGTNYYSGENNSKYMVDNDLPLFTYYEGLNQDNEKMYSVDNNRIFTLQSWDTDKKICEIDDFVASYLLGRAIGPNSSMEDIYYAQKLLIRDREIQQSEKGIWCISGKEGTMFDMTQTVINYQKQLVSYINTKNIFVTGYFDVFTEACILKEIGSGSYGILGL